jgi:GTPase SAR1 family protein
VRAGGPEELAGEGGELAEVLGRVPTGRLVVLGEPGAGKTVLMVRLVLDLLARRASGAPVPVLLQAASWDPAGQDLRGWLEGRLQTDYPWLAGPAPPGGPRVTRVRALLEAGLVMVVLDGLDEIPAAALGLAIARINDAARPGQRLVVTSRTAHWQAAVRPPGGTEVRLRGAAGIVLCPLDADAVAGYLRADAGGPAAAARWDPVLAALPSQPLLARVLSSPLMASLARTVYNPRPGEDPAALPDPAELHGNPAAGACLLGAYIPAAYRARPHGRAGRRPASPQQAGKWLAFLASHLEHTVKAPDLAWWQIGRSMSGTRFPYAVVMGAGFVCGGWLAQWAGISASHQGLVAVVVGQGWFLTLQLERRPSYGISWAGLRRLGLPRLAALTALAAELAAAAALVHGSFIKGYLLMGGLWGIWLLVTGSLKGGLPGDLTAAPSPGAVLARDRRTGLAAMLAAVLVGAASGALLLRGHRMAGLAPVPFAVTAGVVVGVAVSAFVSAWPRWVIARTWLAWRRQLPWRLMAFLADAHQRGVLRQDGAVYQFRHIELQHRLAARPPPPRRLARAADKLAVRMHGHWQAQARPPGAGRRRLVPLRWEPADPSLAAGWDDLVTAAANGAGWPAPHAADGWARSPQDLAGEGTQLAGVLDRVPTGRLAVLGGPWAGKTTLMTRLVLDLLARRASGAPVPVLVPAAAWNPAGQDLPRWLAAQLIASYPRLARNAPSGARGRTRADALLAHGLILPILDGLDEIPPAARSLAITKINHALRPGERLVVTSRTMEWQQAVRPASGTGPLLDAAAVIQLYPPN